MSGKRTGEVRRVEVACPICGGREAPPVAQGWDFEYDTTAEEFVFRRCGGCGVLYLSPRPDVSELDRIYPEEYAPYHFEEKRLTLRLRDWLEGRKVRALGRLIPAEADILDVGCGGPGFLENLKLHGGRSWRLWGNDIAPEVLADLERRGFKTLPGRFEEADLPDGSFDAIFMRQAIEHLDAPREALESAARLLRRGGRLVVETPNSRAWDARLFGRRYWGGYHFPRHWTLFDPRSLAEAGERTGLETEEVSFMLSPSFWVQSAHHFFKDRGWPPAVYERFSHLDPAVMAFASSLDVLQKLLAGRTSNMRIVFRKP